MFSVVACLYLNPNGWAPPWPGWGFNREQSKADTPAWLHDKTLPGPEVLFGEAPPVSTAALAPSNSVDELNAGFINSGPFKFRTTLRLDQHLMLNHHNEIFIYQYWSHGDRERDLNTGYGRFRPFHPSGLDIYTNHALKRLS